MCHKAVMRTKSAQRTAVITCYLPSSLTALEDVPGQTVWNTFIQLAVFWPTDSSNPALYGLRQMLISSMVGKIAQAREFY